MKTKCSFFNMCAAFMISAVLIAGCSSKEQNQSELAVGNWTQYRNRAYTLLVIYAKGDWHSTVRIADVTSKIVSSKGKAGGTWHIENNQMIFSVAESDIEKIWEPNATLFYDIVELKPPLLRLKDEAGYISEWKQTSAQTAATVNKDVEEVIPMGPIVVNLNKNRSNDKDRYLCMDLSLVLKELMPGQQAPPIHPRARDAAIVFLSSLVFNDVKDFDSIKQQNETLVNILNPYMESTIEKINVEHVIVANNVDKVDEFIIEHTMGPEPESEEDQKASDGETSAENDSEN